ncbi:uncharacterized protein ARMOST_22256 [Armillaria ostoyae]|uniref:Uncharacterized protein n=1 Tax=Armillaria ostoyae TaxID=47428 RepID=A0A284SCE5_ARMOS|nr:uncharacterized protein ARMOST_22256 [Armillaria ostoyae]
MTTPVKNSVPDKSSLSVPQELIDFTLNFLRQGRHSEGRGRKWGVVKMTPSIKAVPRPHELAHGSPPNNWLVHSRKHGSAPRRTGILRRDDGSLSREQA